MALYRKQTARSLTRPNPPRTPYRYILPLFHICKPYRYTYVTSYRYIRLYPPLDSTVISYLNTLPLHLPLHPLSTYRYILRLHSTVTLPLHSTVTSYRYTLAVHPTVTSSRHIPLSTPPLYILPLHPPMATSYTSRTHPGPGRGTWMSNPSPTQHTQPRAPPARRDRWKPKSSDPPEAGTGGNDHR